MKAINRWRVLFDLRNDHRCFGIGWHCERILASAPSESEVCVPTLCYLVHYLWKPYHWQVSLKLGQPLSWLFQVVSLLIILFIMLFLTLNKLVYRVCRWRPVWSKMQEQNAIWHSTSILRIFSALLQRNHSLFINISIILDSNDPPVSITYLCSAIPNLSVRTPSAVPHLTRVTFCILV